MRSATSRFPASEVNGVEEIAVIRLIEQSRTMRGPQTKLVDVNAFTSPGTIQQQSILHHLTPKAHQMRRPIVLVDEDRHILEWCDSSARWIAIAPTSITANSAKGMVHTRRWKKTRRARPDVRTAPARVMRNKSNVRLRMLTRGLRSSLPVPNRIPIGLTRTAKTKIAATIPKSLRLDEDILIPGRSIRIARRSGK